MSPLFKNLTLASVFAFMLTSPVLAEDEYNTTTGVTPAGYPIGMHGMDTVEATQRHAFTEGTAEYASVHDGVMYYFSSEETKAEFEKNPEAYLPQFGGFCAFGVALGKKFDGDPRFADIVDGKLYLFLNAAVYDNYIQNAARVRADAHQMWPGIQYTAATEL